MLKTSAPSRARRIFGASCLTISVLLAGTTTWAAQPKQAHDLGRTSDATPSADQVKAPPVYPNEVLAKGIGGMVVLVVDVAADGAVINAVVDRSSNNSDLDAAAMEAVKSWKFQPAMKDGKAVASKSRVPIEFNPDSDSNKKKS